MRVRVRMRSQHNMPVGVLFTSPAAPMAGLCAHVGRPIVHWQPPHWPCAWYALWGPRTAPQWAPRPAQWPTQGQAAAVHPQHIGRPTPAAIGRFQGPHWEGHRDIARLSEIYVGLDSTTSLPVQQGEHGLMESTNCIETPIT
jgi:hypothetical protein